MITLKRFCDKYKISKESVYTKRSMGIAKEWVFMSERDGLMIDEDYLIKYREEADRLWLVSHDYYYYLNYVVGISDIDIARRLVKRFKETNISGWSSWLTSDIFMIVNLSIISKIRNSKRIQFIEWAESVIPKLDKILKNEKEYKKRLKDMV